VFNLRVHAWPVTHAFTRSGFLSGALPTLRPPRPIVGGGACVLAQRCERKSLAKHDDDVGELRVQFMRR
jgi:hypothetical protein